MISRTNIMLAAVLAIVVAMNIWIRVDLSRTNFEILPDMKYSPAWSAFAANPNFRNGRTLQAPVPGTVARGSVPLHYAATKEDAIRAGEELRNPYDLTIPATGSPPVVDGQLGDQAAARRQASIQRGSEVFGVFCSPCHGPAADGNGLVAQRGFPPPPSLLTVASPPKHDGQLFHILTYGQGNMSPFAAQLSPERRWDVINHIRDLQQQASAKAGTSDTPAASPDLPTTGELSDGN